MKCLALLLLSGFSIFAKDLRVATYNASLFRKEAGQLAKDCRDPKHAQLQAVAAVVRASGADVLLLNEFDYDPAAIAALLDVHLHGLYPYHFSAPVNTGCPSGMDLNRDGDTTDPEDCFGYGTHPGQYGMLLLSRFPIDKENARTFQHLLWQQMPGNVLPAAYYQENAAKLRLSSKSHWDVPIRVAGKTLHVLCSHPTPPSFDDGQVAQASDAHPVDWNGRRNHDEIRFWAEYIKADAADWIVDDLGKKGPIAATERFVILGDLNADPLDGNSMNRAILQLLDHPLVLSTPVPRSEGAGVFIKKDHHAREEKTSRFHLRCDYVLPSKQGCRIEQSAVHWPVGDKVVDEASDHRLVWVDLSLVP